MPWKRPGGAVGAQADQERVPATRQKAWGTQANTSGTGRGHLVEEHRQQRHQVW